MVDLSPLFGGESIFGISSRTFRLGPNLVRLELRPCPVRELIRQDGREEDLGDGPRECLVKFSLRTEGTMLAWSLSAERGR